MLPLLAARHKQSACVLVSSHSPHAFLRKRVGGVFRPGTARGIYFFRYILLACPPTTTLQGSSLELVKTTYKQVRITSAIIHFSRRLIQSIQLALRTHPDKNPDDPKATAEFQRVSEAYNVLVKHLDQSSKASSGFHTHTAFSSHNFYEYDNSDDGYEYDDYGYYEEASDSDDDIAFYLYAQIFSATHSTRL
jgi:hypothetical protein